jgi:hypothetical protein
MRRTLGLALLAIALYGASAEAQWIVGGLGPGSTVEGDYLRGVGVAAWGLGSYNLQTAQAMSINVDTTIRWNEYFWSVLRYINRENAENHARIYARHQANYEKILERIRNTPEEHDVMTGDALNAEMEKLNDPRIYGGYFQSNALPLSADIIRTIPFSLDEKGARFSMLRLSTKGKGKWPIALRDDRFTRERKAYERAFDNALDQQISGKMGIDDIKVVEDTIEALARKLDEVIKPSDDPLYVESFVRIRELRTSVKTLKYLRVEIVIGEIEGYAGTTVNDLRVFMQKHKLRFDRAETKEERELYPRLYAALVEQREVLTGAPKERAR